MRDLGRNEALNFAEFLFESIEARLRKKLGGVRKKLGGVTSCNMILME